MGRVDAGFCAGRAESEGDGDMRGRGRMEMVYVLVDSGSEMGHHMQVSTAMT